jgi:hypothetical protein
MTAAYEGVIGRLKLADRADPLTEIVARRIIDYAAAGERDPIRIRDSVLEELDQPPATAPRATQPLREPSKREIAPARANQRFQIEFPAKAAFRTVLQATTPVIEAPA